MSKKAFLLLITTISALGGLLFGYDTGAINEFTWNGSLPYSILIIVYVTYKFIPKTKRKSLEEIEGFWKKD